MCVFCLFCFVLVAQTICFRMVTLFVKTCTKHAQFWFEVQFPLKLLIIIDIEYNKRLDRQRPCLEDDFNGGSNNIVQSNKSV